MFAPPPKDFDNGRKILDRKLDELGYTLEDISRVYLTHGHPDHLGMAGQVVEATDGKAPVSLHKGDTRYALTMDESEMEERSGNMEGFFQILGLPPETLKMMKSMREAMEKAGGKNKSGMGFGGDPDAPEPLREVQNYDEGDKLEFDRFTLEVLHTPGHTGGQCCLHDPENKLLFVGDHVLPDTSPIALPDFGNTDMTTGRLGSLMKYVKNAKRVQKMDIDIIFPGHGDYITDHKALLDSLFKYYDKRQAKIVGFIEEMDEPTTYDVAMKMFPDTNPMMAFLALTEAAGHLEILEEKGALEITEKDGPIRYRTTG